MEFQGKRGKKETKKVDTPPKKLPTLGLYDQPNKKIPEGIDDETQAALRKTKII